MKLGLIMVTVHLSFLKFYSGLTCLHRKCSVSKVSCMSVLLLSLKLTVCLRRSETDSERQSKGEDAKTRE